jgi:integrase
VLIFNLSMIMRLFVSFILRKSRERNSGKAPVYIRFTLDGRRVQLSTGVDVEVKKWDAKSQQCKGRSKEIEVLNGHLQRMKSDVLNIYNQLSALGVEFNVNDIKNRMLKVSSKSTPTGIVGVFEYYLSSMFEQLYHGYSMETYKHYKSSRNRIKEFIKCEFMREDVLVEEIDYQFLDRFDRYLKKTYKVHQNTAWNYHKHLRRILNLAISLGYIKNNPYEKYKVPLEPTNREFLSLDELKIIENKTFEIDRIENVKNIFVFACYTGLSYADLYKLSREHLVRGEDGNLWLVINRTKTNNRCRIPLLPMAKEILELYIDYPPLVRTGKLLPVKSNQRLNSYLKEIADCCKINKNLTMHMARHTFATSVTLSNGVPIETVSKLLGHSSFKTTQIYARILDMKISEDMRKK